MRNPFKQRKVRQSWESVPKVLTLDDPVYQDLDKDEDMFKPRQREVVEPPRGSPLRLNGGSSRFRSRDPDHQHDNSTSLGYASIAGALAEGNEGRGSSDHSNTDNGVDSGSSSSGSADGGAGSTSDGASS